MAETHYFENTSPHITELQDGTKIIRTSASGFGCHNVGCGLKVTVKDGCIIKIEGDPENPITKGKLCVRCLSGVDYIYHKDRILYPLKRAKKDRGNADKFERCSWDEAYDLIIKAYWDTVEKYGVNSVSVWNGTGREACRYHFQFANHLFGSTSAVHPNSGWSCMMPRNTVVYHCIGSGYAEYDYAAGFPDRYDDPRWACPKYMLVWGRNQLRSNADGLWGHSTIEMMKRGMKLIVVDPRVNWLAIRAELHLQLRPGTDAALALGILNVLIQEHLYDQDFVDRWCYGFDELKVRAAEYPADLVEAITEVPAELIVQAARLLSQKPSTLSIGLAVDQNPNCFQIIQAVYDIFALCGQLDIPGGVMLGLPNLGRMGGQAEVTEVEIREPEGLEKFNNEHVRPLGADVWPANAVISNNTHPDYTLDVLENPNSAPYPLKFAYIFAHNPIACMVPQPKRWAQGLAHMDFVAVADIVMTPTIINCADVVLPVSSFLEHDALTVRNSGAQPGIVAAVSKCIEPLGESKSDCEILCDLYKRLYPYGTKPWTSPDSYFEEQITLVANIDKSFADLKDAVVGILEIDYKKYEKGLLRADGQPGFNTPTGRVELWSTFFSSLGEDPLPYYAEPLFSAQSRPDLAEKYPLTLTTGARRFTSFHSENRHIKVLREIDPWPKVEINPVTASNYGIVDGQWVYIENQLGRAKFKAKVTPIVKEGVVSAEHGWWYPERNPNDLYDVFESNACNLVPHEQHGKLGFGTHYKCMPCTLYPVENKAEVSIQSAES